MFNTLYNSETGQYAVEQPDGSYRIADKRLQHPDTGQYAYQFGDEFHVDEAPSYYEGASEQPDEFDTIEGATGDKTGERDWLTGRYEGIKATASNVLGSLAEEVAAPYRSAAGALFEKDPSEVGISVGGADLTGFAEDQFKEGAYHRQEQQKRTPEGGAAGFATHALDSMMAMAPAIVTTYATKSPNLGLGVMGVQVFADEYGSVMAGDGERSEALKEAAIQVAFELGPEKAFGFFDNLPGARGMKDWLKQVATEALSEGVTEALNVADEAHRKGEDVGDAVKVAQRLGYASALGATIGGGMSMPALAKGKKQPESPEDWADWSAQLNAQIESEKQKQAAEVERLAKLAKVTEFDVEMDVDAPQGVGVIADTSQIAPAFAPESVIPPELDPTSPEAIAHQQRASDALDQSYETAIERLEPTISPFDTTLPVQPEPEPEQQQLPLGQRATPEEMGFTGDVRDISQPTKTLYADLNALAEEMLEIDTMPLDELIERIQTDMPVDTARYFETDPDTGKLFKSPAAPFNLVSRMTTKEVLANMDPEDRLRYHSAKNMDERGMIEAEFRQALKDARKEEAEAEFGSTEEMFRDELRRQARQRYEADDRTLYEMSGREVTDYAGVDPTELSAAVDTKRQTAEVRESVKHAEQLDATREDAEAIGSTIMETGIPYLSRPSKTKPDKRDPGWSVLSVEPEEGRVYAQYETKGGGTYIVSWRIGEGYGKVSHARTPTGQLLREGTNKGLETVERPGSTSGAVPRVDSNGEVILREGGGLPNDFRNQVDKMAIAAMTSADGVIKTPARGVAGGKVATIPFEGTKPMRFAVREAQRQAVKDARLQADKYNKPTEEDLLKVREQAAKDAAAMQEKVKEQLEANTAARGGELVKLPNVKPIKQDLGGKNITLIDQAAKTRLLRSESIEEFATQILPDGSIRTIKLVPNEAGTKYKAVATSRGLNNFATPFEMGDTTLNINLKKAEEAQAATAKAKRLDVIRTKAMEAQDTDAQREARKEYDRIVGTRKIKAAAATTKAAASKAAKSLPGEGTINIAREEESAESYSEPALKVLDELIRQTKQRANDPATGRFIPVSVRDLNQKKQEILTLLRAGVDKATPVDERGGQITTEYEGLIEPIVIQEVFGNTTSVDNLTPEELQEIYQTEEWREAVDRVHADLGARVDTNSNREAILKDRLELLGIDNTDKLVAEQIRLGKDWGDAITAVHNKYAKEFTPKEARKKEVEAKDKRRTRRAEAKALRETREGTSSIIDDAREFPLRGVDPIRERLTEVQLSRRGRLRPTAEEGPVENLAEKAVQDLSAQIEQDKKDAALDAKIAATKSKEMLLKLKEIDKDNKADKQERKREMVRQQEQIDKLAELVEQDKLARQMERLRERREDEAREAAKAAANIGQPEQLELGVPDVFEEPPARIPSAEEVEIMKEVPLSPPQIKRQQKAEERRIAKLAEEKKKADKRRKAAQKKKDSETILKLYGIRNFGKASSWDSIGKDVAVRHGKAFLKNHKVAYNEIDAETKQELQWDQEFSLAMQDVMAAAWRNATPEQRLETTVDPTPEHVDAATETIELGTEDITEVETFVGRRYSRPLYYMRKLKSAFSRKQGLSTKDSTFKVRDFIEQRQAEGKALLADMHDLYLKFEGQVRRDGWGKNLTEAQSRAVNGYLQGMSRESIAQAYDVKFSEPAIDRLNEVKLKLRQFSVNAQAAGVFSDARIITVIQEGRPYLHAVSTRNMRWHKIKRMFGKDARVTPKEVEGLHDLFVAAWDLPMTEEAVNDMKRGQLKKLINKHSVYTQGLPNEQDTQNTTWSYIEREDGSKLHLFEKREAGEPLKWAEDVTTEELREYVKSVELTDEAIDHMIETTVNNIIGTDGAGRIGGAAAGTNKSIQQERRYLQPDMQTIYGVLNKIVKRTKEGPALERIKLNRNKYESMSVDEFIDTFSAEHPEYAKLMDKTRKHHELNLAMRELLGEAINPEFKVADTAHRLVEEAMLTSTLSDVATLGIQHGWASLTPDAAKYVQLAPADTPLGRTNFMVNGSQRKGSELYIDETVAEAFISLTGGKQRERGAFMKSVYAVSGAAKYGMVIASPLAHARNFTSSLTIHLGNGGVLGLTDLWTGSAAAVSQARSSIGKTSAIAVAENQGKRSKWLVKQMNKLGLLHDGSQIGALEDVFRGMKTAEDVFALSNEYTQAGWTVGQQASTATGRAAKAALKFAGRTQTTLFRLEDEAVKGVALLTQTRQYLSIHGENPQLLAKALKGDALTEEEQAILDRALAASAESIKNTYPTFSRVAPWAKSISRFPIIGAFPAFSYEMARNTVHSYYDNLRLMAGITPDGREVKGAAGKAKAMGIASVNLASRTALLAGSTAIMGWVGSMIYGMLLGDDEEDKNAIPVGRLVTAADEQESYNSMLPWYEQHGTNYIYNTNPEERSFEYAVLDYLDPYGGWKKAVNERIAEYVDLVGAGDSRKARLAAESSFGFFSDIFLNDEVIYGSTLKRFAEKGVPKGSATDRASKMIGDAVEKTISDTAGFVVGPGPVPESMGALGGAIVENIPGMQWVNAGHALAKTLQEAGTPEGMAASEIMIAGLQKAGGVKGKKYVFERDFWRAVRNQKNKISQADTTQKRLVMESKAKTYEEYRDEFRIADAARRVAFDHLHANVQSVRDMLGVDTLGIEMELNKAGVKSSVAGIPREYIIAGDYISATPAAVRTALEKAQEAQIRDGVKDPLTLERIYELEQWHIQAIGDKEDL